MARRRRASAARLLVVTCRSVSGWPCRSCVSWTSMARSQFLGAFRGHMAPRTANVRRTPRVERIASQTARTAWSAVVARGRLGLSRGVREVGRSLLARVLSRLLSQPSLADGVLAIDLRHRGLLLGARCHAGSVLLHRGRAAARRAA